MGLFITIQAMKLYRRRQDVFIYRPGKGCKRAHNAWRAGAGILPHKTLNECLINKAWSYRNIFICQIGCSIRARETSLLQKSSLRHWALKRPFHKMTSGPLPCHADSATLRTTLMKIHYGKRRREKGVGKKENACCH